MAATKGKYIYPVKTVSEARTVTAPEFQPDLFEEKLYVNLDEIRDITYLNDLYFDLGFNIEDKSFEESYDYVKVIFSGHRGCGKSAELRRIDNELNMPERYFTVFIDLEQEVEVGSFQYADFYALIIHKLIEQLTEAGLSGGVSILQSLAKRFLESKTVERKAKAAAKTSGGIGANFGFKLFGLEFNAASFKQEFSGESETATIIRQEIKRNTLALVEELNVALVGVRDDIIQNGKGRDLLIIVDGSEKVQSEVYTDLFVKNGAIISEISLNMVIAVPITAHYQIEKSPFNFTKRYTVPMIKLDKYVDANDKMKEIIGCRVDLSIFIEDEALNTCIHYSGGCIRQLFQVVNVALRKSLGRKIGSEHVSRAVTELGKDLWELLDSKHLAALKIGKYQPADPITGDLLYVLILLKYNGKIEINPLLKHYPDFEAWMNQPTA